MPAAAIPIPRYRSFGLFISALLASDSLSLRWVLRRELTHVVVLPARRISWSHLTSPCDSRCRRVGSKKASSLFGEFCFFIRGRYIFELAGLNGAPFLNTLHCKTSREIQPGLVMLLLSERLSNTAPRDALAFSKCAHGGWSSFPISTTFSRSIRQKFVWNAWLFCTSSESLGPQLRVERHFSCLLATRPQKMRAKRTDTIVSIRLS